MEDKKTDALAFVEHLISFFSKETETINIVLLSHSDVKAQPLIKFLSGLKILIKKEFHITVLNGPRKVESWLSVAQGKLVVHFLFFHRNFSANHEEVVELMKKVQSRLSDDYTTTRLASCVGGEIGIYEKKGVKVDFSFPDDEFFLVERELKRALEK